MGDFLEGVRPHSFAGAVAFLGIGAIIVIYVMVS